MGWTVQYMNGGFYLENRTIEERFEEFSPWEWNIYEVAWGRSTRIPR